MFQNEKKLHSLEYLGKPPPLLDHKSTQPVSFFKKLYLSQLVKEKNAFHSFNRYQNPLSQVLPLNSIIYKQDIQRFSAMTFLPQLVATVIQLPRWKMCVMKGMLKGNTKCASRAAGPCNQVFSHPRSRPGVDSRLWDLCIISRPICAQ